MEKNTNTVNKNYKKYIKIIWILFIIPFFIGIILFYCISKGYLGYMPTFEELENPKSNLASEIYSSDQVLMGTYYIENRSNINFSELSPNLINALVATEDIRFYKHSGVDIKAIGRAVSGIFSGKSKGGGSTITQQLAKMLFPREDFSNKFQIMLRKLREWVMAVKLEKRYTKEEIITMYFNKFDFLNLAVGIKTASKVYFNTTPQLLNIEQAAMLVGMAKNPSLFNPLRRHDLTLQRRNVVISQMEKYEYITEQMKDSLMKLPLKLNYQQVDHKLGLATYFREYLRMALIAKEPIRENYIDKEEYRQDSLEWKNNPLYGWCNKNTKPNGSPYNIYKDGLKIYTTINSKMQQYAEDAVTKHLSTDLQKEFFKEQKGRKNAPFSWNVTKEQIKEILTQSMKKSVRYQELKRNGKSEEEILSIFNKKIDMRVFTWKGEKDTIMSPLDSIRYYKYYLQSGLMSMETQTGYVRAYVGGINYKHFQYDHVKIGKRQVGSTFKPFLYTLAMQEGLSPCYEVPNIPVTFDLFDGTTWSPQNSDVTKKDGQMVTLKWGLANSVNNISAWLMKQYSPQAVVNIARKMGIRSKIDAVPALCLGTPDISVYEMVGAYNTFANKGVYIEPIFVTRIEDKNGNVLAVFKPNQVEAISEETAYLMINLLQGVVQGGTSARIIYKYNLTNEIAAKTGTTQNQSDGWYVGITPNLVTGIWVGGEDRSIHFGSILYGQGANMALPIWALYMQKVYADKNLTYSTKDVFEKPSGLSVELNCNEFDKGKKKGYGIYYDIIE